MTWEAVWDVLKWVLLVLVAGFIGQFGKSLALNLIERRRRRRAGLVETRGQEPLDSEAELERIRRETEAKREKKRLKAEAKKAKKSESGE